MSLKKRIEKLEQLQKQNACNHIYHNMHIEQISGDHHIIELACLICDKKISRTGISKELNLAIKTLRDFLLGEI